MCEGIRFVDPGLVVAWQELTSVVTAEAEGHLGNVVGAEGEELSFLGNLVCVRLASISFSHPFSREELASFLCVNRTPLSHELSLMQQEGLISFDQNTFTIS